VLIVDAIGVDKNTGNVVINEYKSSSTAPLTKNQKVGFPQLESGEELLLVKEKGYLKVGIGYQKELRSKLSDYLSDGRS